MARTIHLVLHGRAATETGASLSLSLLTIPYFDAPTIGAIQPWGLFVACGAALGVFVARYRAKKLGLDPDLLTDFAIWILVAGFIGARAAHVFLYDWDNFKDDLWSILRLWEGGLSSYGSFVAATLAAIWFLKSRKVHLFKYGDIALYAFMPGWTVGRLGCFAIHDHPGALTDFFMGVEMRVAMAGETYSIIQARHDLGLYDAILTLGITVFFVWAGKQPRKYGFFTGWSCILYGIPRFFLDYLRATDVVGADTRYVGLTPAQYGSIILLALGVWLLWIRQPSTSIQEP